MTRREFFAASAAAAAVAANAAGAKPPVCVFSKPLDERSDAELARIVQEAGADGVDLSVRGNGHVKPERVAEDLPRAVEAIRARGLAVPMITTALTSAAAPAPAILSAAARLKIPYFKLGYWMWKPSDEIDRRLAEVHADLAGLVALAKQHGIVAGYHNHSGNYVGEALWDTRELLRGLDPRWVGYYFDPCHATIEGGLDGWEISERIALSQLKMVAVKDFYWEKRGGRWDVHWCPLGEGMVDWDKVFRALAGFSGPISIHVEYEPADVEAALAHDVRFVRQHL